MQDATDVRVASSCPMAMLFLPINSTTTLGLIPSSSPVLDPPEDVLGLVGVDARIGWAVLPECGVPDPRDVFQKSVMESPMNNTPTGPALCRARIARCWAIWGSSTGIVGSTGGGTAFARR